MDGIRIGLVSSVNAAAGKVRVAYTDSATGDSAEMPYFSFGGIYKMPQKGQMVLCLHLSNGSSSGIVLGMFWNDVNKPPVSGENDFWMDLAAGAMLKAASGAVTLKGSSITLQAGSSITVDEIIQKLNDHEQRITALGG
jgi:phage baseplate assembly protein gpV